MISTQLKYLFKQIVFVKTILARLIIILFKKNKNIEIVKLNYNTEFLFSNSFLVIEYNFTNALCYSFNHKKTLEKSIKIFNLQNIDSKIDIVVFGLFRKKKYSIKIKPTLKLENHKFKTNFSNFHINLNTHSFPKLVNFTLEISIPEPHLKIFQIDMMNKPFTVQLNNFNQNEFI